MSREPIVGRASPALGRPRGTPWTKERYARLAELRDQGFSASQIAVELGGVTRNAVIGTAYRLGLVKQETGMRAKAVRKPKPQHHPFKPLPPSPLQNAGVPVIDQQADEPVTLIELQPHHCRWPIGDSPNIVFCGGAKLEGYVYCEHHCSVAYEPHRSRMTARP